MNLDLEKILKAKRLLDDQPVPIENRQCIYQGRHYKTVVNDLGKWVWVECEETNDA